MKQLTALFSVIASLMVSSAAGQTDPKPFPALQAIPQPDHQVSFQRDAIEIARYHFGPDLRRPFVYPLIGPSNRPLTRMGHPHDPESHSHHNSVWISHNDVNGVSFWDDRSKGRIVHQRIEEYQDQGETSWITTINNWLDEASNKPLLQERRRTTVRLLPNNEFFLIIDLQLESKQPVTLGKTPFGLIGVRMAKTIGVNDGGGSIRNSQNKSGEKDTLWQRAKWLDYSGPITPTSAEGITLMDHPQNPNHPTFFHTRADGWMGASLTYDGARTIEPGKAMTLRYGLWVHTGKPSIEQINNKWSELAGMKIENLPPRRKL